MSSGVDDYFLITDDDYLVIKDEDGNVVRLEPIEVEPIIENGEIVGYLRA